MYEVHIYDSLRRIAVVDAAKGRDVREGVSTILADGESLGPYLVWLEDCIGQPRTQEGQFTSRAFETEQVSVRNAKAVDQGPVRIIRSWPGRSFI